MDLQAFVEDLTILLEGVIASPLTIPVASAIGFVLGLVARPLIEQLSGHVRERATERRGFQRATLLELRDALHAYAAAERASPAGLSRAARDALDRVETLATQVSDPNVRAVIFSLRGTLWRIRREGLPLPDPEQLARYRRRATPTKLRRAHEAIGDALRRL